MPVADMAGGSSAARSHHGRPLSFFLPPNERNSPKNFRPAAAIWRAPSEEASLCLYSRWPQAGRAAHVRQRNQWQGGKGGRPSPGKAAPSGKGAAQSAEGRAAGGESAAAAAADLPRRAVVVVPVGGRGVFPPAPKFPRDPKGPHASARPGASPAGLPGSEDSHEEPPVGGNIWAPPASVSLS